MTGEPLSGGNMTAVTRVGGTIRRDTGPWSAAVHQLLPRYEAEGIGGVPRFLGIDDRGRETLAYLPGEIGGYPLANWVLADETPALVGVLTRRMHDATTDLARNTDLPWQIVDPDPERREVICHHDIAPYNAVWNGQRIGLIDFDTAGPGAREWDLAYAAYRFCPFHHPDHAGRLGWPGEIDRESRLKALCDAYGGVEPARVLAAIPARIRAMLTLIDARCAAADPAFLAIRAAGDETLYHLDLDFLHRHEPV